MRPTQHSEKMGMVVIAKQAVDTGITSDEEMIEAERMDHLLPKGSPPDYYRKSNGENQILPEMALHLSHLN